MSDDMENSDNARDNYDEGEDTVNSNAALGGITRLFEKMGEQILKKDRHFNEGMIKIVR